MGLKIDKTKCIGCGLCDVKNDLKQLKRYCPAKAIVEENYDNTTTTPPNQRERHQSSF